MRVIEASMDDEPKSFGEMDASEGNKREPQGRDDRDLEKRFKLE